MDEAKAIRELLTWFLATDDAQALAAGLSEVAPALWPAFSAEAAAELGTEGQSARDLHRHLLGEERRRREY